MLLIATDEAGYGPKLGPLVIVATAWHVPDDHTAGALDDDFAPLRDPIAFQGITVKVDDSKAVFQPGKGLDTLHAVTSASMAWCRTDTVTDNFSNLINKVCPEDQRDIDRTPWLQPDATLKLMTADEVDPIVNHWNTARCQLLGVQARVITAEQFNRACANGSNKADLLSRTTLNLARTTWEKHAGSASSEPSNQTMIYCDRHGGRRYYAAVLQHTFPSAWIRIEAESPKQSVYQFDIEGQQITAHFTVKGDSFTPVALASMHAKYMRERMMDSFNRYFDNLSGGAVKPTAGYPVDADRFLKEIDTFLKQNNVDRESLVRCR
ncbi:MAG: hypothetical protein AAGG48_15185 [Planctomycetota bacterium]